jgi:hypothetical protein
MNLTQIIEALPLQVYVRRGELVIHFSTPADLISRVARLQRRWLTWTVSVRHRGRMEKRIVLDAGRMAEQPAVRVPRPSQRDLSPSIRNNPAGQGDRREMEVLFMAIPKFSKFIRPATGRRGHITDRDLDILDVVLRYRFMSAAQIVRLAGGNEDVTHRRLRRLWERELINVCPAKAGVFSGSQPHQNKSQSSVAWMAGRKGN